ncbi:hypothetical protein BGZ76_011814 [Entomortierella beljakovae]|nr:hypothetical protein BGZ76_011814 [Entomortierella beljakovae]
MEYLQGMQRHGHSSRQHSSAGGGSSTTGSTTGSSYGYSISSGNSTSGGGHYPYHHHSGGFGLSNLNAAVHHHQQQRTPDPISNSNLNHTGATSAPSPPRNAGESSNGNIGGKLGSANVSAGSEQQSRNSTKRAAQNRAAQRAFRQRKDLYVRDLERKAELLQQAEGKIMQLTARNRELEAVLAAQNSHKHHKSHQLSTSVDSTPVRREQDSDVVDQERGWKYEERASAEPLVHRESYDVHHSPRSSVAPRLNSAHQLRHAYSTSSHTANDTLRQQYFKKYEQGQQHQRPESDGEFDNQDIHQQRRLQRHPSEPSLKTGRSGSNSADSGEEYNASRQSSGSRRGSGDYILPPRSNYQNEHSEFPESSSSFISSQEYQSSHHSTLIGEKPRPFAISTQGNNTDTSNYLSPQSTKSRPHQADDTLNSHPSLMAVPSHVSSGGMVAATSPVKSGFKDYTRQRTEMEYLSNGRSPESEKGYELIRKQSADGVKRSGIDDVDMQDSLHYQQQNQPSRLQHRASTGSVSIRDSERQHILSSDNSDVRCSELKFGGSPGAISPYPSRHQHQYSPVEQQSQPRNQPQSPEQIHRLGSLHSSQNYLHQHGSNGHSPNNEFAESQFRPRNSESDMDGVYEQPRSANPNYNETSMVSP